MNTRSWFERVPWRRGSRNTTGRFGGRTARLRDWNAGSGAGRAPLRVSNTFLPVLAGAVALAGFRAAAEEHRPARYQVTHLVSDQPGLAAATDPNLVNPWGLTRNATGPWWVSDNGTGKSTLYDGSGAVLPLVVTIPNPAGVTDPSPPTGVVFNGVAADFLIGPGMPARFLFATELGTIAGWNSGTSAVLVVDHSSSAVYKGLAIATVGGSQRLYAANFSANAVDVFDATFHQVQMDDGAFRDPELPANFAPFNVQSIGDAVVVTFAEKEAGSIDEVHGPGKGFVDIFAPDGKLRRRLRWGAWFNAPWGVAMAPSDFGRFSHLLLVGQFGSGKIAAFDPRSGGFRGLMRDGKGMPLAIDGLWALAFGNGAGAGPSNTLFFTAGIDDEAHGLFGTVTPAGDDHGENGD